MTDLFNSLLPPVHYQFEDNLLDSTGNTNTGTINIGGTETYITGIDGQAFDFDGLTHIETADTPFDFERDDSFSISTWFKTDVTGVSDFIFGKINGAGAGYQLLFLTDDEIRFRLSNSGADRVMVDTVGINVRDGNWHLESYRTHHHRR